MTQNTVPSDDVPLTKRKAIRKDDLVGLGQKWDAHYYRETAGLLEGLRDRLGKDAMSREEWNALGGAAIELRIAAWRKDGRNE